MYKLTAYYILTIIGIHNATSCNNSHDQPLVKRENKLTEISSRDTTITVENSYTELFLDSIKIEDLSKIRTFPQQWLIDSKAFTIAGIISLHGLSLLD